MRNEIPIKLSIDSKSAVSSIYSESQASILELVAARAFSVGINSLYKNAIDALYDDQSPRFYHDYKFPGPAELAELLENEELQRIHDLPHQINFKTAFADPNIKNISTLWLSDLNGLQFMQNGDQFQICLKTFRKQLISLDFDEIFKLLHDQIFFFLFPEEYDELLDSEHDLLTDWLNYYSKLHWNRTKSDISTFMVEWVYDHANLNEANAADAPVNKLKALGISDKIYNSVLKIKNGKNPVAVLSPILIHQDIEIIPVSKLSNIQFT